MLNGKQEIFCERIYFDRELWLKTMLPKLTSFYFTHIIYPSIVRSSDDIARGKTFFRILKHFILS